MTIDDEIAGQLGRWGVPVTADGAPQKEEAFEVMSANAEALDIWLACSTQWRVAVGLGGILWLGLDYSAVNVMLQHYAPQDPAAVMADLQVMEAEALAVFGAKSQ